MRYLFILILKNIKIICICRTYLLIYKKNKGTKIVLFCNFQHNSKAKSMTNLKFVIAIVVFFALNNWSFLNNIFNIFNGGTLNFLSLENLVMELIQLSKVASTSCTISLGLFAIFVKLAFMIVIAFILYASFKSIIREKDLKKNTNCYTGVTVVKFATNNIYLQNNKLIC